MAESRSLYRRNLIHDRDLFYSRVNSLTVIAVLIFCSELFRVYYFAIQRAERYLRITLVYFI